MKPLRIYLLIILLCCCLSPVIAQTDTLHRYKSNNTFCIRGKLWIWPVFLTAVQTGIGFEYGFNQKYSIGLQGEFSLYSFPNDTDDHVGPRLETQFVSCILTFKRYSIHNLYWGAFCRYGVKSFSIDQGYKTDTISYSQKQYSAGILAGIKLQQGKRFWLDINGGPFIKQKDTHDVYMENNLPKDTHFNQLNIGLRIDVSFVFNGKRKSNHLMFIE